MSTDELYYKRYTELSEVALRAYYDYSILKAIEGSKEQRQLLPDNANNVISHYIELLKDDLGLCLSKLHEEGDNLTGLPQLNRYLREKYQQGTTFKMSQLNAHLLRKELRNIRNHRLAHIIESSSNSAVKLDNLGSILTESIEMLNSLCYIKIDERVQSISDTKLTTLAIDAQYGIASLLSYLPPTMETTFDRKQVKEP